MRWTKTIQMIEAHAEGEVGRIVTSGVMDLPGTTMLDKMNYLNRVDGFWFLSHAAMPKCLRICCFHPPIVMQMLVLSSCKVTKLMPCPARTQSV